MSSKMPSHAAIDVQLKLHTDVQDLADEWSGISNPIVRRKLQNRLNQRATRRRKAEQQKGLSHDTSLGSAAQNRALSLINPPSDLPLRVVAPPNIPTSYGFIRPDTQRGNPVYREAEECTQTDSSRAARLAVLMEKRPAYLHYFQTKVLPQINPAALYPLPADHLLSLIYYNVHRALVANCNMLELDIHRMCTEDAYQSPFISGVVDPVSIAALPTNLRPTYLQTTIPHHPQWDIFPDPALRDNALLRGEDNIDDVELALELLGDDTVTVLGEDTQSRTGMIVWGQPWDIKSWEVTERFARKYPWFLFGAEMLLMSTNEWRKKRGELPMVFT